MIGSLSHEFRGAAVVGPLTSAAEHTENGLKDVAPDLAVSPKSAEPGAW
ncbi:hypothetical protein [Streptomyces glycanivorans]|uniref:Uncharacterized protein n=1 Tax=Streptomyces glycanivorans TaxID=3033808 RepID=A0ABY9JE08_9ACTN|nr:hypothetical protein [Streptomyces sp. Alt3]WLQ65049.1 hypothetical protein P8A20_16215 [Streptomyces sp. Alt3]